MYNMSFGDALDLMKAGYKATRLGWSTEWIWIQEPDANYMSPYLEICVDGVQMPYTPTQEDMLTNDWEVFN